MNFKPKPLFNFIGLTFTGLAIITILSFFQDSSDDKRVYCENLDNVVLDHELPVSHPANICANKGQAQVVSWSEWFTGRSSSYQFHFIDLLELLSRSGNSEAENPAKTN
jgi:hypothetical protein